MFLPRSVQTEEDKEEDREAQQGRASVAKEGKRNTNDGSQPDYHPDVYRQMEEKDRGYRITIHAGKDRILPFCQSYKPKDKDGRTTAASEQSERAQQKEPACF